MCITRVISDLQQARLRTHKAVMDVRRSAAAAPFMLPCGNEIMRLPDGRVTRLITRADYFGDEPVVFQTADERRDAKARRPDTVMGGLLFDEVRRCTTYSQIAHSHAQCLFMPDLQRRVYSHFSQY